MAIEAIAASRPGGDYFGNPQTVARYRSEIIEPMLPAWGSYEAYADAGRSGLVGPALNWASRALADYEAPALEVGTREELDAYAQRRMEELPDIET